MKTTSTFNIGSRTNVANFPVILCDSEGVNLEAATFLRWRFVFQNVSLGTVCDDAYILVEWIRFIHRMRSSNLGVTERIYLTWVSQMTDRMSRARVARKIDVIHQFSKFTARRAGIDLHSSSPFYGDKPAVSFPKSSLRRSAGRPTPSMSEAERVADILAENQDPYLSVRDFLLCQWKIQVGLRDQGLNRMNLACLQNSLCSEGIHLANGDTISSISVDQDQQLEVCRHLHDLQDKGRKNLILEVTEKGEKTRNVPVPIPLMILTLEFIWNERADLLGEKKKLSVEPNTKGVLWISKKTRNALSAKAIGRLLKEAFNRGGIRGSGHRLRALFANNLVRRLYNEACELRGSGWDASLVLLEAAEILGHARIETMRPYLDRVRREDQVFNDTYS